MKLTCEHVSCDDVDQLISDRDERDRLRTLNAELLAALRATDTQLAICISQLDGQDLTRREVAVNEARRERTRIAALRLIAKAQQVKP